MRASPPDVGRDQPPAMFPDSGAEDAGPDAALPSGPFTVYVGESDGTIHWGTFDPETGSLVLDASLQRGAGLNFLAVDSAGERLYAAIGSEVEAFELAADGTPSFLGSADAGIGGTALAVDDARSFVMVASYGGDAISVLPLDPQGLPSDAEATFGGGNDPDFCRRAHHVRFHPEHDVVYVPCLASDHIATFRHDPQTGDVIALDPAPTHAGAGPRHIDVHPTLPVAYAIGELDDTVTIFDVNESGELTARGDVTTRPQNPDVLGPGSDVHVSPDGRYLAAINRDPRDELVVFEIDSTGALTHLTSVSNGGVHARTFTFLPSSTHLLVGNSNSQDVVVFGIADGLPVEGERISGFDSRVMYVGHR